MAVSSTSPPNTALSHSLPPPPRSSITNTPQSLHSPAQASVSNSSSDMDSWQSAWRNPNSAAKDWHYRMGIQPVDRLTLAFGSAAIVGGVLGGSVAGQMAGLRFQAEHAHMYPTSQRGWFFYHRTKNYHFMRGWLLGALPTAARSCFWASAFLTAEAVLDASRHRADFLNTTLATLSVGGFWSLTQRLNMTETARVSKICLFGGLAWGLFQDLTSWGLGRKPGYIKWLQHRLFPLRGIKDPSTGIMMPEYEEQEPPPDWVWKEMANRRQAKSEARRLAKEQRATSGSSTSPESSFPTPGFAEHLPTFMWPWGKSKSNDQQKAPDGTSKGSEGKSVS